MRGMVVYRIYSTLATTLTGSLCTKQPRIRLGWSSRLLSLIVLAALLSCSDPPTDTPPPAGSATLQQTGATFTSVDVRVIANGFDGHPTLRIVIDDTLLIGGFGVPCDTTITIANLLPSTAYRANVLVMDDSVITFTGDVVLLRTKDTLSTDYELIGLECGVDMGHLDDALYLSRNDVWATGEFTAWSDSAGKYIDYNAAHYDGARVTYHRIPFYLYFFGKELYQDYYPITRVHYFEGKVWFFASTGATVYHDGALECLRFGKAENGPGTVASTWSNVSGLYVGCYDGKIRHFSGATFNIFADTQGERIVSCFGYQDTLYAISSGRSSDSYGTIYRISGGACVKMEAMKPPRGAIGMWISPEGRIHIGGPGPHYWDGERWVKMGMPVIYYFDALCGAGEDRIFMANTRSQVAHFNGHRWNLVPGTETYTGIFYNLDAGSDGFCAVGRTRKNVPIMLIGRHK
jgi:hypothetical protein